MTDIYAFGPNWEIPAPLKEQLDTVVADWVADNPRLDPNLNNAVVLGSAAAASRAVYDAKVAAATANAWGKDVFKDTMEDANLWAASYGSWIAADTDVAYSGTKVMRLPANNTNTVAGKPVHMYSKVDAPVVSGRKYMIRARVRTLNGAPGAQDSFQALLAKANGSTQTYWSISDKKNLTAAGVSADKWTLIEIPWTATETVSLRIGPQATSLVSDLLVDDVSLSDVADVTDMSTDVAAAKAVWQNDVRASIAAWRNVQGFDAGSGGAAVTPVTRAQYDALPEDVKKDGTLWAVMR